MSNRLAILIPTIAGREHLYERLEQQLELQMAGRPVIILSYFDNGEKSIGWKRNWLVSQAMHMDIEYCAFFDDDDYPSPDYVAKQLEVVESSKDCGSLWGRIYFNCRPGMPFHHSIQHKDFYQDKDYYYRPINHLNTCKTAIRAKHLFPDQSFGEDCIQALAMAADITSQHDIEGIVYHYFCGKHKGDECEGEIIKQLYNAQGS